MYLEHGVHRKDLRNVKVSTFGGGTENTFFFLLSPDQKYFHFALGDVPRENAKTNHLWRVILTIARLPFFRSRSYVRSGVQKTEIF